MVLFAAYMRLWQARWWEVGLILAAVLSVSAIAQEPATSGSAAQAAARIRDLQAEADQLARAAGTLLTDLRRLEIARQIKSQEVQKAELELAMLAKSQEAMEQRLASIAAERAAATPLVHERLVAIYKRGRGGYLRLLVQADNLQQLGRLSRGVASVARLDQLRVDAQRRTVREEQAALGELAARRAQAAGARDAAAAARRDLDAAIAAQAKRIDEVDQRRDLAAQYVGELQAAQTRLQQRLENSKAPATSLPILPFRGMLDWPVNGRLLASFGRGSADRLGTAVVRNGIEISTIEAQQVRAVHAGTVSYAAPFAGFGTLVIVDHGTNAFSLYGHLSRTLVTEGATGRAQRGHRTGRPQSSRCAVALFRAAHRRAPGRSRTMAQEFSMKSRGRLGVLMVSVPVLAFAVIGGFMGKAMARQESLPVPPHLRGRRHPDRQQLRRGSAGRQGDGRARCTGWPTASIPTARISTPTQVKAFDKNERRGQRTHRARADATVLPARDRRARRLARGARRPAAGRLHPRHRRPVDARHLGLRGHAPARRQAGHQGHARGAARQRRGAAPG